MYSVQLFWKLMRRYTIRSVKISTIANLYEYYVLSSILSHYYLYSGKNVRFSCSGEYAAQGGDITYIFWETIERFCTRVSIWRNIFLVPRLLAFWHPFFKYEYFSGLLAWENFINFCRNYITVRHPKLKRKELKQTSKTERLLCVIFPECLEFLWCW